jgi:hypothetical protein
VCVCGRGEEQEFTFPYFLSPPSSPAWVWLTGSALNELGGGIFKQLFLI